jgi:hypothetical protein
MFKKNSMFQIVIFGLILVSISVVKAIPNVDLATDSTNDVERIHWTYPVYDYKKGNFKDEIDIVSLSLTQTGGGVNFTVTLTCQATPIFDGVHVYWIWISFDEGGTQGENSGAWFWAGGVEGTEAEAAWWIWGNTTDYTTFAAGSDEPMIDDGSHSLSWETDGANWDDFDNHDNWEIEAWAWTSDNTTYAESLTSGFSYWDYYPNENSGWESGNGETSESEESEESEEDGNGGLGDVPGFEIVIPFLVLPIIILIQRKQEKY